MQLQADMLGVKINRSDLAEASALGAALTNALALGRFGSLHELTSLRPPGDYLERQMPVNEVEQCYAGWRMAVERARFRG
jgi:glycerol kinase